MEGKNRPIDKVYYVEMDIDMLCDYESFVLCDTKEYHIEMVNGNIQFTYYCLNMKKGYGFFRTSTAASK